MEKKVKYIGLDVLKSSISIGIADENRDGLNLARLHRAGELTSV
jgi:hypothetical protein